jgi:hypothetical protein
VCQRNVLRPDVISKYFNACNVIDSHNQVRQYELALEKQWIVHDGWFRIITTIIGMTVTDCWRAYKHALPLKKHKEITVKEFADRMAYDCIKNCHSNSAAFNGHIPVSGLPPTVGVGGQQDGDEDDISTVTAPTTNTSIMSEHVFQKNHEFELMKSGKSRPKRRVCRAPGCRKEMHFRCSHPRCEQFRYSSSHGWVYGVFYCTDHFGIHYQNILNDANGGF